ncbi:MAG: rhomboid family intramembrane serine protease, partial [Elusimicrobia bacterium]|nr:rhomboid family intramembrane serine protease [Elusimicrobiota bacterium]
MRIESVRFEFLSPTLKALLIANVLCFFLSQVVGADFIRIFGLIPVKVWREFWLWQLGTYLFLHGSFWHLVFNCFVLWMFGRLIEAGWGSREFLKYFFITGMGAALFNVVLAPSSGIPVVGASGAIYGLLVAFAMMYPDSIVYFYFLIPMTARQMAILLGLLEFVSSVSGVRPGVSSLAHLGGMLTGYIYLRWWWVIKLKVKGLRFKVKSSEIRNPQSEIRNLETEVDRILDKVAQQ